MVRQNNLESMVESESFPLRPAVRGYGLVVDSDNKLKILLGETPKGYLKAPGGGIDKGEDPLYAMKREMYEEMQITPYMYAPMTKDYFGYLEYESERKGVMYLTKMNVFALALDDKKLNLNKIQNHLDWVKDNTPDEIEFLNVGLYTLSECYERLRFPEQRKFVADIFRTFAPDEYVTDVKKVEELYSLKIV